MSDGPRSSTRISDAVRWAILRAQPLPVSDAVAEYVDRLIPTSDSLAEAELERSVRETPTKADQKT